MGLFGTLFFIALLVLALVAYLRLQDWKDEQQDWDEDL